MFRNHQERLHGLTILLGSFVNSSLVITPGRMMIYIFNENLKFLDQTDPSYQELYSIFLSSHHCMR